MKEDFLFDEKKKKFIICMRRKYSGVYIIYFNYNLKVYVGSSRDLKRRFKYHRYTLKKGNNENKYLQYHYNKLSLKNMRIEILEYCNEEDRLAREQYWIDTLDASNHDYGFNIIKNAIDGKPPIVKWTKEIEEKRNKTRSFRNSGLKHYIFVNPLGEKVEVFGLKQFCNNNNLNSASMCSLHKGNSISYKGWTKFLTKENEANRRKRRPGSIFFLKTPDQKLILVSNLFLFCKKTNISYSMLTQKRSCQGFSIVKKETNIDEIKLLLNSKPDSQDNDALQFFDYQS